MNAKRESVRGTGRDTAGATSVTMQIWYELNQAGEAGLTFEEVLERVKPRVPLGYAWRRYLRDKDSSYEARQRRAQRSGVPVPLRPVTLDTPANRQASVRYVVRNTVNSMIASRTALKRPDGHLAALRKPRSVFTDEQHDFDGSVTRKQVAMMEWLRLARALVAKVETEWKPKHEAGDMPTLTVAFYAATRRLVEAQTS